MGSAGNEMAEKWYFRDDPLNHGISRGEPRNQFIVKRDRLLFLFLLPVGQTKMAADDSERSRRKCPNQKNIGSIESNSSSFRCSAERYSPLNFVNCNYAQVGG